MDEEISISKSTVHRLHTRLDMQDSMLSEIKRAIVGDAALGHKGLVARIEGMEKDIESRAYKSTVNAMEKKVESHDRKIWLVGIIAAFIAWAFPFFFDKK